MHGRLELLIGGNSPGLRVELCVGTPVGVGRQNSREDGVLTARRLSLLTHEAGREHGRSNSSS